MADLNNFWHGTSRRKLTLMTVVLPTSL